MDAKEQTFPFDGNYKTGFEVTMRQLVERITLRERLRKNGVAG